MEQGWGKLAEQRQLQLLPDRTRRIEAEWGLSQVTAFQSEALKSPFWSDVTGSPQKLLGQGLQVAVGTAV